MGNLTWLQRFFVEKYMLSWTARGLVLFTFVLSCRVTDEASSNLMSSQSVDEFTEGFDVCDVSYLFKPPGSFMRSQKKDPFDGYISAPDLDEAGIVDVAGVSFGKSLMSYLSYVERSTAENVPTINLETGAFSEMEAPGMILDSHAKELKNWKITAFRFNPLSLNPVDPTKMKTTIKLILQPMHFRMDGRPEVQDMTFHVSFDYESSDVKRLVEALYGLKKASPVKTTGVPLGVHPAFEAEGLTGPFSQMVRQFLFKELARGKMTGMAMMGLTGPGEPWAFVIGAVTPKGWAFINLPQIGGQITQSFVFTKPIITENDHTFEPLPKVAHLSNLFPRIRGKDEDIERIQTVDNPKMTNIVNGDCVSCHVTTQSLLFYPDTTKKMTYKFFDSPNRYRAPEGISAFIQNKQHQAGDWNLRNFGFFGVNASVSMRTVNETAEVVSFLNKTVLQKPNPADWSGCNMSLLTQCYLALGGQACEQRHCAAR